MARATIHLKDPLVTKQGGLPSAVVYVDKDTAISAGPTSARFIVVDYDPTTEVLEAPAKYDREVVEFGRVERKELLDFSARPGTPQEAQINAWVTAIDTLDLFQQPLALGRDIPWAFEGSRLRILPHALPEANAFYSRQTRGLHFGYFTGKDRNLVKTALSHDVVAHETAHAVLDGLRPFYLEAHEPDTAAFHEYVGDLAAMLSLFREREALASMAVAKSQARTFRDVIGALAPEVGKGLYGEADRYFLRSAANRLTYRDVRGEPECHRRSQVLSGFALDALSEIYALRRKAHRGRRFTGRDGVVALFSTARAAVRMLLRPLDMLPPGSLRFDEYAAIVLRLDAAAYPRDDMGFRVAVVRAMKRRGIHPTPAEVASWERESSKPPRDGVRGKLVNNRDLIERDFAMIRSSRVGAYRFLNANRDVLGIPRDVDFRVIGMGTNQREGDHGVRLAPETVIQYVWDVHVPLDAAARRRGLDAVVLHPGGALVIDEGVNVRFWQPQEIDERAALRVRRHVSALLHADDVETDPGRHVRSDRPVLLIRNESGGLQLRMNTATMHRARAERGSRG